MAKSARGPPMSILPSSIVIGPLIFVAGHGLRNWYLRLPGGRMFGQVLLPALFWRVDYNLINYVALGKW